MDYENEVETHTAESGFWGCAVPAFLVLSVAYFIIRAF